MGRSVPPASDPAAAHGAGAAGVHRSPARSPAALPAASGLPARGDRRPVLGRRPELRHRAPCRGVHRARRGGGAAQLRRAGRRPAGRSDRPLPAAVALHARAAPGGRPDRLRLSHPPRHGRRDRRDGVRCDPVRRPRRGSDAAARSLGGHAAARDRGAGSGRAARAGEHGAPLALRRRAGGARPRPQRGHGRGPAGPRGRRGARGRAVAGVGLLPRRPHRADAPPGPVRRAGRRRPGHQARRRRHVQRRLSGRRVGRPARAGARPLGVADLAAGHGAGQPARSGRGRHGEQDRLRLRRPPGGRGASGRAPVPRARAHAEAQALGPRRAGRGRAGRLGAGPRSHQGPGGPLRRLEPAVQSPRLHDPRPARAHLVAVGDDRGGVSRRAAGRRPLAVRGRAQLPRRGVLRPSRRPPGAARGGPPPGPVAAELAALRRVFAVRKGARHSARTTEGDPAERAPSQ